MLAFRYDEGVLVQCQDAGPIMRMARRPPPMLACEGPFSKKQRRAWARKGKRGRRGARPVRAAQPPVRYGPLPEYVRLDGNLVEDWTGRRVMLYLPEGERFDPARHERDLMRAMERCG